MLHFQFKVRRKAPCNSGCCPPLHQCPPCPSTHPFSPARTFCLSGCVHSSAHSADHLLLLVFCVQMGSEATGLILWVDNATYVLQIRRTASCFPARLECCPVAHLHHTSLCAVMAGSGRCARICPAVVGSTFHRHAMHADIVCGSVLKENVRVNVGPSVRVRGVEGEVGTLARPHTLSVWGC